MTRDEAREYFANHDMKYSDLTTGDIEKLTVLIKKHMKIRNKIFKNTTMRLSKKIKCKCNDDGVIINCFLYMNSHYFTRREAISFNNDGFIGFAGWADDRNAAPLTDAFKEWVDWFAEGHRVERTA